MSNDILKQCFGLTCQVVNGTHYHKDTPKSLIDLLERIRGNRDERVVLIYGDPAIGEVWKSATPDRGSIGRSMGGTCNIPLLIRTRRSMGGESVMCQHILQVRASRGGRVLWTHPTYELRLRACKEGLGI